MARKFQRGEDSGTEKGLWVSGGSTEACLMYSKRALDAAIAASGEEKLISGRVAIDDATDVGGCTNLNEFATACGE
jgi:hypothetical protein